MLPSVTSFNVNITNTRILDGGVRVSAIHCYRDHTFPTKKDQGMTVKAETGRLISLLV